MIAIIDCCGANLASVVFALDRLGVSSLLTRDPEKIQSASHVILPGVGTASHAMQQLRENELVEVVQNLTQPLLGICLGMQLLFSASCEGGDVPCLDIFEGRISPLLPSPGITLPHMGWNRLAFAQKNSPLLSGIEDQSYVYFVHGFAASLSDYTVAAAQHGIAFSAIVSHRNFHAMQFHPEVSGKVGIRLLQNFLSL